MCLTFCIMSIFVIFSRFQISSLGDNYSFVIHHRGRDAAERGPSHGAALFYLDNYCISIVRGQVQTCRGDNKMQHGPGRALWALSMSTTIIIVSPVKSQARTDERSRIITIPTNSDSEMNLGPWLSWSLYQPAQNCFQIATQRARGPGRCGRRPPRSCSRPPSCDI